MFRQQLVAENLELLIRELNKLREAATTRLGASASSAKSVRDSAVSPWRSMPLALIWPSSSIAVHIITRFTTNFPSDNQTIAN